MLLSQIIINDKFFCNYNKKGLLNIKAVPVMIQFALYILLVDNLICILDIHSGKQSYIFKQLFSSATCIKSVSIIFSVIFVFSYYKKFICVCYFCVKSHNFLIRKRQFSKIFSINSLNKFFIFFKFLIKSIFKLIMDTPKFKL